MQSSTRHGAFSRSQSLTHPECVNASAGRSTHSARRHWRQWLCLFPGCAASLFIPPRLPPEPWRLTPRLRSPPRPPAPRPTAPRPRSSDRTSPQTPPRAPPLPPHCPPTVLPSTPHHCTPVYHPPPPGDEGVLSPPTAPYGAPYSVGPTMLPCPATPQLSLPIFVLPR